MSFRCPGTRWPCRSGRGPSDSPAINCSSRSIAPENSSPSLDSVSSTVRSSSIKLLDDLVVVGERVRERRRLREQRLQRSALPLQDLDQRRRERVDVLRIQALDNGFQAAEQQVEIQRGRRPVHRYLCADRQDLRRLPGCRRVPDSGPRPGSDSGSRPWCRSSAWCCGRRRTSTSTLRSACSDTPFTVPTRMPAIRTVSPASSRDASLKTAEYSFVAPVLDSPKTTNRKAVNTDHDQPEDRRT